MPRPLPSAGDRVKVYLVGAVTGFSAAGMGMTTDAGTAVTIPATLRDDDGFGWEIQEKPEPVYLPGEVYRDQRGSVFLRNEDTPYPGDAWTVVRADDEVPGQRVSDDRPSRPLRRLIPEA
ncbi:hypothetical protein [Terrabacter terrigena]|uniref:Uncharacterized protein n=1 Tax=Terrabacter terrigena TaxID=574718 RepID=A0ABW3MXJ4_9MICO